MPVTEERRLQIEARLARLKPEQIATFLRTACDSELEPGLSLAALESLIDRCPPEALAVLRERLEARGSTAGLARIQAIIDKHPDRR